MSSKKISLDYTNSLMFELQKAFWDERGKGARFRMTTVGRDFYMKEILPLLDTNEIPQIITTIEGVLSEKRITGKVSYSQEDRLLRVSVKGCIHRQVEDQMLGYGIEPFTCIPANLIVLAIEEKLDRPVELAEIKLENGSCHLLLVIFEERPSLG
jgi:hypothetical protein